MTKVTSEPFYLPVFVNRNTNEKVHYSRHSIPQLASIVEVSTHSRLNEAHYYEQSTEATTENNNEEEPP